jgi:hypothetical protein
LKDAKRSPFRQKSKLLSFNTSHYPHYTIRPHQHSYYYTEYILFILGPPPRDHVSTILLPTPGPILQQRWACSASPLLDIWGLLHATSKCLRSTLHPPLKRSLDATGRSDSHASSCPRNELGTHPTSLLPLQNPKCMSEKT